MGSKPLAVLVTLTALSAGCSCFFDYACENLTHYPINKLDDCTERQRNVVLAHAAWREVEAACPDHASSKDYRCGFLQGYADYLYYGGKGDPPAVPPWNYQTMHYQTPAGYLAAEEWFAGFRHGVEIAKASGRREFMPTVFSIHFPPQLLRMSYIDRINYFTRRSQANAPAAASPAAPAEETLPPPRILDEKAESEESERTGFATDAGGPSLTPPSEPPPPPARGLFNRLRPSATPGRP